MAKQAVRPVGRGKWEATLKNIRVIKAQIRGLHAILRGLNLRVRALERKRG